MYGSRHIYCGINLVVASLPRISDLGIGIEVLFDDTRDLWPQVRWENLLNVADALADEGIEATVHGPFHGLNLGTADHHVREYSLAALTGGLEAARAFRSPVMVFHTGYLPQYPTRTREQWVERFCENLELLVTRAADLEVRLAMENTYEQDLTLFQEIFARFPTPALGMCLDVAHATCYGRVPAANWALTFADRICHIHCSDNDGKEDTHWELGRGQVDFRRLLAPLAKLGSQATVTFETPLDKGEQSRDYFFNLLETIRKEEPVV
ncbi:sugar phosphate isomerase/epimerase [candidate division KSB1 bacterium]|nr:sugar phosphate isomerase/epimerase [candidate division KSB1 bacterium]